MPHIWLRHEYKSDERRAPITPEQVGILVNLGHQVTVERSAHRVFGDDEYKGHGAALTTAGDWHTAPQNAFILGIKEKLQDEICSKNSALRHRHIYFAHVFKGQKCTPETMRRFIAGKGTLLDLEYLVDGHGKRVAAFSYSAGFAGAIAAAYIWAEKELGGSHPYRLPNHFLSRAEFIVKIREKLNRLAKLPSVLIIGANGRSGQGAFDLFQALDVEATKWGKNETQSGGPFSEILQYDIMCNCVFLAKPVAPFLTAEQFAAQNMSRLSVVADVSNELSFNPIFGISSSTTFRNATVRVGKVDVIEIENLPALTPLDSSIEYANQLFPHLLELLQADVQRNSIWERAALTYFEHQDIPQLAIELGRELAELFLSDRQTFGSENIRDYVAKLFAKNFLSGTDRLYFVDYLTFGAREILPSADQVIFVTILAKAGLSDVYDSPQMREHHQLLKAVYDFSRSPDFECVTSVDAKDDFFEMCDCLAEVIDLRVGAEMRFAKAKKIFQQKLGRRANNLALKQFSDATKSFVASARQRA